MRLYLLPISTRRTLLYCQKLKVPASDKQSLSDKIQGKAARTWAEWEKKESGWQKSVVNYGNLLQRRIPYEEWGLKSVPPLSQSRKDTELKGTEKVEVIYPKSLLAMDKVPKVLETLATEREALHRKILIWCFVGMPFTLPVGLIPLIPNIPFFYLVYRAWSHWRALSGGRHIQFLLQNNLLAFTPSAVVDEVYTRQKQPLASTPETTTAPDADQLKMLDPTPDVASETPKGETLLLSQENGKSMTQALKLPALEIELERAIWQVEAAIKKSSAETAAGGTGNTTETQKGPKSDDVTNSEDKKSR